MSKSKRMCCPECGYNYGFRWMSFAQRVFSGFPSSFGMRCRGCNAVLCLKGKNKVFAECMLIVMWLVGTFFGIAFSFGAMELLREGNGIAYFITYAFIVIILLMLIVFGIPFIIHWLIIVPFCRNLGYISTSKNAEYIVERRRWSTKRWPIAFFLTLLLILAPIVVSMDIYGVPKYFFYIWYVVTLFAMVASLRSYKSISSSIRYLTCFAVVFFCSIAIVFRWGGDVLWLILIPVLLITSWGVAISLFVNRKEIEESCR